jgi:transcriptional regulator with XRE-family HTH domain
MKYFSPGINCAILENMNARDNGIKSAIITPAQIRAARALLDWSRERLSEESGVPMRTLARVESGEGDSRSDTFDAIKSTLTGAGILFIKENGGGPGVRLKKRTKKLRE